MFGLNNNLIKSYQSIKKEDSSSKNSKRSNKKISGVQTATPENVDFEDEKDIFLDQIEEWLATGNPSNKLILYSKLT